MKNFFKFLGIISLSLIIGFSMASCGGGGDDDDNKNGNKGGPSFWTAADLTGVYTTEQTIISVASSGSMFIATTDSGSGKLAKSDDGVTWTVLHSGGALPGTGMNANKVAYGNGLFFAMNKNVVYSENNGATWNAITGTGFGSSPTDDVNGIVSKTDADGTISHFIAFCNRGTLKHSADGKAWYSPTGIDYISGGLSTGDNISDGILPSNYSTLVLVGKSGLIVSSQDPSFAKWSTSSSTVNMTAAKTGPFYAESFASRINVNGVAYSNTKGILVAVGDKGKIAYSSDGSVWIAATSPFGDTNISDVAFGNGKFVAVGYGGKTATSDDTGKTWTLVSNSSTADIYNIAFGGGKFVAVGKGWIGYSE